MAEKPKEYQVGFKKPPLGIQFKKGNSGNPGGQRRLAPATINDALAYTLARRVSFGDDGERMSSLGAIAEKLVRKALAGDIRSIKIVIDRLAIFSELNDFELIRNSKQNEERELVEQDAAVDPDTGSQAMAEK